MPSNFKHSIYRFCIESQNPNNLSRAINAIWGALHEPTLWADWLWMICARLLGMCNESQGGQIRFVTIRFGTACERLSNQLYSLPFQPYFSVGSLHTASMLSYLPQMFLWSGNVTGHKATSTIIRKRMSNFCPALRPLQTIWTKKSYSIHLVCSTSL